MSFVIDASMALAWSFDDEAHPQALQILDRTDTDPALAPTLWAFEVANGLMGALRRKRLQRDELPRLLSLLEGLNIQLEEISQSSLWSKVLPLAIQHQLSIYDATYLELAIRHRVPLATLDRELARAAKKSGVELLMEA